MVRNPLITPPADVSGPPEVCHECRVSGTLYTYSNYPWLRPDGPAIRSPLLSRGERPITSAHPDSVVQPEPATRRYPDVRPARARPVRPDRRRPAALRYPAPRRAPRRVPGPPARVRPPRPGRAGACAHQGQQG